VPLPEILSEITASGPTSQTVERNYERLLSSLGAELSILEQVPVEDIARAESSLLAEGIARLRAGKVIRDAGYDGEYGVIRLFEPSELRRHTAGGLLFDLPKSGVRDQASDIEAQPPATAHALPATTLSSKPPRTAASVAASGALAGLDPNQCAAAAMVHGPLLIIAGPGSGKTRTLTHRIAHLVADEAWRRSPASRSLHAARGRRDEGRRSSAGLRCRIAVRPFIHSPCHPARHANAAGSSGGSASPMMPNGGHAGVDLSSRNARRAACCRRYRTPSAVSSQRQPNLRKFRTPIGRRCPCATGSISMIWSGSPSGC
jgi:hypothetical protein